MDYKDFTFLEIVLKCLGHNETRNYFIHFYDLVQTKTLFYTLKHNNKTIFLKRNFTVQYLI